MFSELRHVPGGGTVAHQYLPQLEADIRMPWLGTRVPSFHSALEAEDAPYLEQEFHERFDHSI